MGGNVRTFILDDGTNANVPEENIDRWMQRMDARGVKFRTADMSGDMTVGEPEVIKTEPPATPAPSAPAAPVDDTPRWLRALAGHAPDPSVEAMQQTADRELAHDMAPTSNTPKGLLAGAINGVPGHYIKAAGSLAEDLPWGLGTSAFNDFIAPYRSWDAQAEGEAPIAYAIGDMASSMFDPINKVAGAAKLAGAAGSKMRALGNIGAQAAIAAGDSALREYADNGSLDGADAIDALKAAGTGALLSAPQAAIGRAAEKQALKRSTPEAIALRADKQAEARARGFGINPQADAWKNMDPDKRAAALAEMESLNAQRGGGLLDAGTVAQNQYAVKQALESADAERRSALEALAAAGASPNPDRIASGIRGNMLPGNAPEVSKYNAGIDARAQAYNDMPREVDVLPEAPPAATPPPLPAPRPQAGPPHSAYRMQPRPVPISSWAEVPPTAAPPQPPPPDAIGALAANNLSPVPTPGDPLPTPTSADLPSPTDPDPVGALAAEAAFRNAEPGSRDRLLAAKHNAAWLANRPPPPPPPPVLAADPPPPAAPPWQDRIDALQPPGVPVGDQSGLQGLGVQQPSFPRYVPDVLEPPSAPVRAPWDTPEAQGIRMDVPREPYVPTPPSAFNGMGMQEVPLEGVAAPRGMSVPEWDAERTRVGIEADNLARQKLSNESAKQDYAAIMDAGREAFQLADPTMAPIWDRANSQTGTLLNINTLGKGEAAAAPRPILHSLGGFGAGATAGGTLGGLLTGGNPLGIAAGAATGLAAGNWYNPRANTLRANWLSKDTAAMYDAVSNVQRAPVGSVTAAARDDGPPPPAADDANGPTSRLDPGTSLGRNTSDAMRANPSRFMPYAEDYNKARTDDERAAVTERLYRTNPQFEADIFPTIQGSNIV